MQYIPMARSIYLWLFMFSVCMWKCKALLERHRQFEDYGGRKNNDNYNARLEIICSRWNTSEGTTIEGLLVLGQNVMLGDFVGYGGRMRDYCNVNRTYESFLVILSSNSFIIDEDFRAEQNLNKVVVAPKWIVFDERKINLDGWTKEFTFKGMGSREPQCIGLVTPMSFKGYSGMAGDTGGSFLGIGEQFFNGVNLTITANGGDGEPGGGGGNRPNGWNGSSPKHLGKDRLNCKTADLCIQEGHIETIYAYDGYFNCSGKTARDPKTSEVTCKIEIHGNEGQDSQDGGLAGAGGPGGHPGIIEMIDIRGISEISVESRLGVRGVNGKGGHGGLSGATGDTLVYSITEKEGKVLDSELEVKHSKEIKKQGREGTIDPAPVENPHPPRKQWLGFVEAERILSEYKSLLMDSFSKPDDFQKKYVSGFYSRVDSSIYKKRCSRYTIGQLMDNLRALEEDYHKFNKPDEFLDLYKALLEKIRIHSEPPCLEVWTKATAAKYSIDQKTWEAKVKPEQVKVLRFLYTATLGRVYSMKDHADTVVITDIGEYLNSVQRVVQELQEVKNERSKFLMVLSKLNTVKQYKTDYGKYIGNKLDEANALITKQILPEIDKINSDTMATIDKLLKEIEEIKEKAESYIEELKEKEAELREAMKVNAIFGVFRVIGLALNFIPGVGPLVGVGFQFLMSGAEFAYNSYKADGMAISEFTQLQSDYTEFKEAYNNHTKNGSKIEDGKKPPDEPKRNKGKELLNTTKEVALGIKQVVTKYQGDKSKLEQVQEAIEKGEKELEDIKNFENKIRGNFKASLSSIGDSMKSAVNGLKGKSHAVLDITKWKITSTLKSVMGTVKAATTGFKVQEEMVNCIENMQDTMKTLVELFEQIQNHQEQLTLANFIADVSAASATDVNITNSQFLNITHHLQLMIASNLVIQKYREAVNAFKQFVFPFAHLYFDGLTLPASMTAGDNLADLVNTIATQVDHLVKKLNEYKQTVKKQDEIVGVGKFSSKYESTSPFYVWKNKNHRDIITKLFSCEEVVLIADIRNSSLREDAVKFNSVQFSFKVTDEHKPLQSKLDSVLKKFEVMATHMGTSYYRYRNKTYMIMTNSLHFWYNIEKDEDGRPVRRDVSYDKTTRGDYSLSPYAVWKLQLSDLTDDVTCMHLEQFVDKVDVELVGEGNYVKTGKKNKMNLEVDTYYKSFDMDQIDKLGDIGKGTAFEDLLKRVLKQKLYFENIRHVSADEKQRRIREEKRKKEQERAQVIERYIEPFTLQWTGDCDN